MTSLLINLRNVAIFLFVAFFRSTVVPLTVVSHMIASVFNRQIATSSAALNISKDSDRVWYGVSCQILSLIFSFVGYRWFWMGLAWRSSLENHINASAYEESILVLTLFLQYINYLSDDVICKIDLC